MRQFPRVPPDYRLHPVQRDSCNHFDFDGICLHTAAVAGAFGIYSYVLSAVLVLQTSLFYALPIALTRFFPEAARDGRRDRLLKEAYLIFYGMCSTVIVISVCAGLLIPLPSEYRMAAWLALPPFVVGAASA